MDIHEIFFAELYDHLILDLDIINQGTKDILTLTGLCIEAVRKTITILKSYVLENGFTSNVEEIHFFKTTKPKFYSLLVYYGKVYELELNRPVGGRNAEISYLKKEQDKMYYFFEKYRDFYQYYRAGATFLDTIYFVRKSDNVISSVGTYGLDTDPRFTTGQDFIISKIEANERLRIYIESALSRLIEENTEVTDRVNPSVDFNWTASKASLIELLYGLQSVGAFNNGSVGLNQIASFFEKQFHVKLGNFHRAFQEIRARKKNRTQFLDDVKKRLIEKMDHLDENPNY